ncbi:MAG TPA: hypothetical protein PLC53_02035 [Bacilli bacterium]|nr:hypothetical protein [Bacilli bacterium]
MEFLIKKLRKDEYIEKRIKTICSFNNTSCNFVQGKIIGVKKTNVSFIEPHRAEINYLRIKLVIIYFDKDNIFLFDRTIPITILKLDKLLKIIKDEVR